MYLDPISCFSSKWICKYIITHGYTREDFYQESKKYPRNIMAEGMLFYVRSWRFLCFTYLGIELDSQFRINTHCLKEKNSKYENKTKLENKITYKLCHWDISINFIWIYLEWTTLHTHWWKQVKRYKCLDHLLIKQVAWQTKNLLFLQCHYLICSQVLLGTSFLYFLTYHITFNG